MEERETDCEHADILYRILYRIPIKSHSEAARKRLGIERSKQNWLSGSIYCPVALPRPTIANANNREWYGANLCRMNGLAAIVIHVSFVYRHQPPNRASDRRLLIDHPKFVCPRSIYALRGGLYNYAMIVPELSAGFIYLLVL